MYASDALFPDAVPVADAVEQRRATADAPQDDDRGDDMPLETSASDWQEQRESVLVDSELGTPGADG